jgi:sulfur carrier protein ThiS
MVQVKLFGYLKDFSKKVSKKGEEFGLTIPEDSSIKDLLRLLGIPEKELMLVINPGEKEKVLTIDDAYNTWREIILEPKDKIWIYPFLDGG